MIGRTASPRCCRARRRRDACEVCERALYGEVFGVLQPDGVFCNLEHVASPTERLHRRSYHALGYAPGWEDRSNRLLDVETQLDWLRELGFEDVDCYWKWLEMALIVGIKPAASR